MTDPVRPERRSLIVLLVAGILLFAACTAYINWVKYVSLRSTYAYDLGFFHNSIFNYAHGRTITYVFVGSWFGGNDHEGPSVFRSNHFSPMRFLFLPQLYRVWPHISTLMFLQSLIIALGALPLYLFGTQRTKSAPLGFLIALSYLLHPVILHMAFNDYRPIQLGVPFALFALWFHASRRLLPFVASSLLMLSCRPEYLFVLALFDLINWRLIQREERTLGWLMAPVVLAALWAALTNAYYLYFYGIPWPLFAKKVSSVPLTLQLIRLFEHLPVFLRITLLPGLVGLLTPEAFAVALPFVAGAKTVRWPAFPHHDLQHISPAVAVVFWAFACSILRFWPWLSENSRRDTLAKGTVLIAALASFAQFGWGAAQAYLIGGFPRYEELTHVNETLPIDATVMVPKSLMARFSNHTRVFTPQALPLGTTLLSPLELRASLVDLIAVSDLIVTEPGEEWLEDFVIRSGRFLPPRGVDRFHIFIAKKDAPRPSNADARLQEILRWNQMSKTERRWANILAQ